MRAGQQRWPAPRGARPARSRRMDACRVSFSSLGTRHPAAGALHIPAGGRPLQPLRAIPFSGLINEDPPIGQCEHNLSFAIEIQIRNGALGHRRGRLWEHLYDAGGTVLVELDPIGGEEQVDDPVTVEIANGYAAPGLSIGKGDDGAVGGGEAAAISVPGFDGLGVAVPDDDFGGAVGVEVGQGWSSTESDNVRLEWHVHPEGLAVPGPGPDFAVIRGCDDLHLAVAIDVAHDRR